MSIFNRSDQDIKHLVEDNYNKEYLIEGNKAINIAIKPSFYVKDETTANDKMWNTIKILSSDYILNGYHTNIILISY